MSLTKVHLTHVRDETWLSSSKIFSFLPIHFIFVDAPLKKK